MELAVDQLRAFISYSRKDISFVQRLASELSSNGYLPDFDQSQLDQHNISTGISAEDEWWTRLEEMMAVAEAIVFVVSSSSVASRICDEEIAFARSLGKRVVPVLCETLDLNKLPPRLAALNIKISFVGEFDRPFQQLAAALETDVTWHREAARIASLAHRWVTKGKPTDQLVRGEELTHAQNWAAGRPSSVSAISDLVMDYLSSSSQRDSEDRLINQIQAERYLAQYRLTEPMVRAEIAIREIGRTQLSKYDHGQSDIEIAFLNELRSLLGSEKLWHAKPAEHVGSTGPSGGHLEIFRFPCCGATFADPRSNGPHDPPSQFRHGGCQDIPERIRYKPTDKEFAWYNSKLVEFYRENKE
jgi:hypothetical protein